MPGKPKRQEHHLNLGDPRVFRFSDIKERREGLAKVASSLEKPEQRGSVYSLEDIEIPDDVAAHLKEFLGGTYHPISSTFIRLGEIEKNGGYDTSSPLALDRSSSQLLAKGLLDLSLSPEGYIVGFSRQSWCRATLCNAAQFLPHLHESAMILDTILEQLSPLKPKEMTAIGVVIITSAEFRDFLARAVRMIAESAGKSVRLDLGPASTLNIPAVMGNIQKYPVDLTQLFPGENISVEVVEIGFHHMIFAALKACLRSTALETSPDSTPLFEAFLDMDDVVYME
ncbi:hypothetical protein CSAL01_04511 [Colletotrichum salicis]|uniref:Uncharacterized protein n=1 Tax=Colletotrichum salicis TaxID=1209931 RepID=A0A135RVE2_9PEZI|nr:hypothetical protein CSAL01_04511 [Colletotrichum salicis]